MTETGKDVYVLYRPEWTVVFVSNKPTEVSTHFEEKYAGRVHPSDVQLAYHGKGGDATVQLQLRLPTLKAEFKTRELADGYARAKGWADVAVVRRGSSAEAMLHMYSVKRLT